MGKHRIVDANGAIHSGHDGRFGTAAPWVTGWAPLRARKEVLGQVLGMLG